MVINEEQFFDYMRCPIEYDMIHNKEVLIGHKKTYNSCLMDIWKKFSTHLMQGEVLSTAKLKVCWDNMCEKYPDIISPTKALEGLGLIMKMYNWAEKEQLVIADKSLGFNATFKGEDDEEVSVIGNTGIIAIKNDKLYMIDMDFSNKYPEQSYLDMRLKYSLDLYILKKFYNKKVGVKVHHVKNDKDFFTMRAEADFKRLESAVLSVGKSIENNLYYPRESAFCRSCLMLNLCKAWH